MRHAIPFWVIVSVIPFLSVSLRSDEQPLPVEVDLRPQFVKWNLPPQSQGARNTCSVFVTVGAFEFALSKRHDRGMPLSVE